MYTRLRRLVSSQPREWVFVAATGLLAMLVIGAVIYLTSQADRHRQAQLRLGQVEASVDALPTVPLAALYTGRGPANALLDHLDETIAQQLAALQRIAPNPELPKIRAAAQTFSGDIAATLKTFSPAQLRPASPGPAHKELALLLLRFTTEYNTTIAAIRAASAKYAGEARLATREAYGGSALAILLAFTGFAAMLRRVARAHTAATAARARAEALAEENTRLLELSREEALTDALTGLGNRRKLVTDLAASFAEPPAGSWFLAIYDLDGFKLYNDRFGHPAGDALLARIGRQLRETVSRNGTAYRMGGDEFCVLGSGAIDGLAEEAAEGLRAQGDGFSIGSSFGAVTLPEEAGTVEEALHLADARLYASKMGSRNRVPGQTRDALLQVLIERSPEIGAHHARVGMLARRTALALDLDPDEVERVRIAAELHDVGKVAIPESVLQKPGALDESEWRLIKTHPRVGERIVAAAPALSDVARIIRATHEHYDGSGYPDGKAGDKIELAARIICVCDAYDAMTNDRPYREALAEEDALAELERCAGSHFDPAVVAAFLTLDRRDEQAAA